MEVSKESRQTDRQSLDRDPKTIPFSPGRELPSGWFGFLFPSVRGPNDNINKGWFAVVAIITTLVTLLAAKLEIDSQRLQDDANHQIQDALTITAINVMESIESNFLQAQEIRDHEKTVEYTSEAHRYEYQAKIELAYAERNRNRASYYQDLAQREQEQTTLMIQKLQNDTKLREEIVANITIEQEKQQAMKQQMEHPWNEGPCKHAIWSPVCRVLGGCIELQRQIDDEYDIIQQDLQQLKATEKREFLEDLVVRVYQNQVDKYNETADYLFQLAKYWQEQSQIDHQNALVANITAREWHDEEKRLDLRLHQEMGWMQENANRIQQLVDQVAHEHRVADRDSVMAVALAMGVILTTIPQLIIILITLVSQICNNNHHHNNNNKEEDICRRMSLGVQHILLFLFTIGWIGSDLVDLDEYSVTKRAVIVGYFAIFVAGLETLLMHAIPHAYWWSLWKHERPQQMWTSYRHVMGQYALRMIFAILTYGMEFLMAWILWKYILFTDYAVRFFSHWSIRCVSLVLVVTHWAVFEPREDIMEDDETVGTEEEGEDVASNSMLPSDTTIFFHSAASHDDEQQQQPRTIQSESSGNVTEDMPLVYFGNMRRAIAESRAQQHNASSNNSPYRIHLESALCSLALVFHVLLIVVAGCIVRNGLALVWADHPWLTILAMIGSLAVWVALLVFFVKHLEDQIYCPVLHDWITWRSNKSKYAYTSIDV